ncbi:hypothetical protein Cgig2_021312 [Carnegiea gigantea]|uniref:Uncharacterized protein n=1 Tax=Carnegiea gigantea TaxID=171969 RepID=A0A9Q1KJU2_9CARY|nr:hypothetical protein Cgig2_021312 [Carnegiea gigantea]
MFPFSYLFSPRSGNEVRLNGSSLVMIKLGSSLLQFMDTFYKSLLRKELTHRAKIDMDIIQADALLIAEQQLRMCSPFSDKGMKDSIFSTPNIKAPGANGFNSGFYKFLFSSSYKWQRIRFQRLAGTIYGVACTPKKYRGLGIKNFKAWNRANIAKLVWVMALKKDLLWVKWVHGSAIILHFRTVASTGRNCTM